MKHSYIDLLREPDSVLFQYEDSPLRFEEADSREEQKDKIDYIISDGCGQVVLYPTDRAVKRVKLRWRGDMSDCIMIMGDAYARAYQNAYWSGLTPHRQMPWFFYAYDGEKLNSFGVKTNPNALCFFECDSFGITLWIDVRNGGGGVSLKEPLSAVNVVCREGKTNETYFEAAKSFCRQMCANPVLPKEPVIGVNNWYWAYGNITHDSVMNETDYLMEMCAESVVKPYMIIDDGWLINRTESYNGGPWDKVNCGFESMEKTADAIRLKGAKAGIWFRPLLTTLLVPDEVVLKNKSIKEGVILDPSHPVVLNQVSADTERIKKWGYSLIKHDFSTMDTIADVLTKEDNWHFYDRTLTNCQILKNLYATIQNSADDAVVIGCDTLNHVVAGIHASQRSGADTSGRNFEITRQDGGEALMRLPQNGTFFNVDPDCAAFTEYVDIGLNLDFLEACAISGCVTLASVVPGILKADEMKRIQKIFKIASQGGKGAVPADWLGHNMISRFILPDGKEIKFDWYKGYDGVRSYYEWMQ